MSDDELAPLPPLSSSSSSPTKPLPKDDDDGGTTLPLSVSFDSPNFLESSDRERRRRVELQSQAAISRTAVRRPTKAMACATLFARFGKSGSSSSSSSTSSSSGSGSVDDEEESDKAAVARRKRRRVQSSKEEDISSAEDVTSVMDDEEPKVAVIIAPAKSVLSSKSLNDMFLFNKVLCYSPARTASRSGDARKTWRPALVRRGASIAKRTAAGTANVGGQT